MKIPDDTNYDVEMVIKDAEDNYDNGRLRDAYKHFSALTERMFTTNKVEEALYFGYRSLLCLAEPSHYYDYLREIARMGLNLMQKVLKETANIIENDVDPHVRTDFAQLQAQLLSQMTRPEQLEQTREKLIDDYELISKEHDLDPAEKIHILEKLIELKEETNHINDSDSNKGRLAQLYIQEAEDLNEDKFNIYQKIHLYQEALKLLATKNPLYQRIEKKIEILSVKVE